jgi:flavodoxin
MKTVVLYESFFGNTRQIAEAIGNSLTQNNDVRVLNVSEISWSEISYTEILIVGSATRAFHPCEATKQFLKNIPDNGLKGIKVAAFDTRILLSEIIQKWPVIWLIREDTQQNTLQKRSKEKEGCWLYLQKVSL